MSQFFKIFLILSFFFLSAEFSYLHADRTKVKVKSEKRYTKKVVKKNNKKVVVKKYVPLDTRGYYYYNQRIEQPLPTAYVYPALPRYSTSTTNYYLYQNSFPLSQDLYLPAYHPAPTYYYPVQP